MTTLRQRGALAAAIVVCVSYGATLYAQDPPELSAPVNDFAGVINANAERQLADLIRALREASGDTIVVATVDTFQPYADLPSYAVKMFENHGKGIGEKGKDNGLLLVLAVKDRAVRVETGTISKASSPTASRARPAGKRWCRFFGPATTAAVLSPAPRGWRSGSRRRGT